jgi:hypothetical protein
VACLLSALGIVLSAEFFVQHPHPVINIRWQELLGPIERTALEQRFDLRRLEQIGPTGWQYEIANTSRDNIGHLVGHADVADTHFIDRTMLEIAPDAPMGIRRPGPLGERWPALAFRLVDQGGLLLLVFAAIAALRATRPHLISAVALQALLCRGIPALSLRGLAAFRFVFGIALALYIYAYPFPADVVSPDLHRQAQLPYADLAPIQWLASHPSVVRVGQWMGIASAVLFAIGVLPRLFFVAVVASIVQWLPVFSLQSDIDQFSVLLLPLLGLLLVPWGDAPPLFRFSKGTLTSAGHPNIRYGYAPWLISVALGVAWIGAAWAKIREGPDWILNGTIRYYLVSDHSQAHIDWGLAIASMPIVAVILSGCAVLIETLTLSVAFVRMPMLRLAMGFAAASLLTAFYLFQGILWPAWWILLLGFLPWHWFNQSATIDSQWRASTVSRGQLLFILGLLIQQILISAAFVNIFPVASRYEMYSKTYASPTDYDREHQSITRRILAEDSSKVRTDLTICASDLSKPTWADLGELEPGHLPSTSPLKACHAEDSVPQRYLLLEDNCPFDWEMGRRFHCVYQDKLIATLPVSD